MIRVADTEKTKLKDLPPHSFPCSGLRTLIIITNKKYCITEANFRNTKTTKANEGNEDSAAALQFFKIISSTKTPLRCLWYATMRAFIIN